VDQTTFREYLEALDAVDVHALTTRFYHDEFEAHIGGDTLDVDALVAFEQELKTAADLHFEPIQIVIDENGIAMDAVRTLRIRRDGEVPIVGPAKEGDRWEVRLNVFYTLRDGRICAVTPNVISVQQAG